MIVTQVRDYLKQCDQVSLRDMAHAFNMDEDALRPIIEQWIAKGKVKKLPQGTECQSGCTYCSPDEIEIYQWVDE